jgi:hypothetical protein
VPLSPSTLGQVAAVDSDWRLIPVNDDKKPVDPSTGICPDDWHSLTYDIDGIAALADSPHVHAIGLALGPSSGVMSIDFDGSGSTATFKEVFTRPYSDLPPTVAWSSGRPNRRQLAFRVPLEYWPHLRNRRYWKRNSKVILELRWDRHQSVIAGAHPDTAGYHWVNGRSPDQVQVADAPDWLLEPLFKKPDEHADTEYTPTAEDIPRAQQLLEHITPRDDYDSWLSIGMALHSVDPGMLTDWVTWSRGCSNFDEEECLAKWASFKGSGLTIGTLHFYAEQDGYIYSQDAGDDDFDFNPPPGTYDTPQDQPPPQPDSPADQAVAALNEDLEHARQKLKKQLSDLEADINIDAILPPLLAASLATKAHSMDIHPSALLGPLITACSSIIGKRARVMVNPGWSEPFVFWAGNILPPSVMKSPIANVIGNVIIQFQLRDIKAHNDEIKELKRNNEDTDHITPARRWMVQDATYERIAQLVAEPRTIGLWSMQDELMGWFERLDARQSAGARAGWLSLWSGSAAMVDRKVAASSFTPSSAVSLFGNVQPDRLINMITANGEDTAAAGDGLWARFLWCRPPVKPWTYNPNGVSISRDLRFLFAALDGIPQPLSPDPDEHGELPIGLEVRIPEQVTIELAAPQWEAWSQEAASASNPARAAFLGKLRGYSCRLAGLLYLLEIAEAVVQSNKPFNSFCYSELNQAGWYVTVPAASMAAALTLSTYYLHQFDAISTEMGSGDLSAQVARFLRKVAESGKTTVSPRDVVTWRVFGRKKIDAAQALRFLRQLVEVYGYGEMVPGRRSGTMAWQATAGCEQEADDPGSACAA